jgi:hypothetical protein
MPLDQVQPKTSPRCSKSAQAFATRVDDHGIRASAPKQRQRRRREAMIPKMVRNFRALPKDFA